MISLKIPSIAPNSGENGDGIVVGRLTPSSLKAFYTNILFSEAITAMRRDSYAGGVAGDTYTDLSSLTNGTVADQLMPWGGNTAFTGGDEFWIADTNLAELFVDLTTSGVWTGDGLEILESQDGETLTPVVSMVDPSNGFRAVPGIYKIEFSGWETRQAIRPYFGVPKKKYIVIRPKNLTAKTTSPKFRRVWAVKPETDMTFASVLALANGAIESNDFTGAPDSLFYIEGSTVYYGMNTKAFGWNTYMYRKLANVREGLYEYYAADGTWKELVMVDPGNELRNGPATLGTTHTDYQIRWAIPADWVSKEIIFAPETAAVSAFWIRYRTTDITVVGPTLSPLYRVRTMENGAANTGGIPLKTARTLTYVCYQLNVPAIVDTVIQLSNVITGLSATFTIPANSKSSYFELNDRVDLSTPLVLAANESLSITCISGGELQDVNLIIQ